MAEPIFTDYRRDVVARTLLDLLKIVVAAAFASKFFVEFGWLVRLSAASLIVALALLGFFTCPRRRPKEGA